MKQLLLVLFIFINLSAYSQTGGLNYVRNFGGSQNDMFVDNALMRNGNLVSVGYTDSNDGHGQGSHGNEDCLLICTAPNGTIVWRKVIGGTEWDSFNSSIDTTTDGNIVVGFTTGSNNGDISGNHGGWDIAFFKFTPEGVLLWSKVYGGSGAELLGHLRATPDGGIIASANSSSSNSGNISGTNHGTNDMWILKLDINGNIEWEKLYGGALSENPGGQNGGSIAVSGDGGYYFTNTTNSTDGDLAGLLPAGATMGGNDLWLCKISATGAILWSKLIGGSDEEGSGNLYAYGNSVYVYFNSRSGDRDLTSNIGLFDNALFKYNNAGVLQWKKQYASLAWDNSGGIDGVKGDQITLVGGTYSHSFAGYPMPSADQRMLIYRIDTLNGNIKWLKALGGNGRSHGMATSISETGEMYVSGMSSNTTGDIYANLGGYDAVVISFAASNIITGTVFIDENNNNTPESWEKRVDHLMIKSSKNNELYSLSNTRLGIYSLDVDTGTYFVKPMLNNNPHYAAVPAEFSKEFSGSREVYTKHIPLKALPNVNDLTISLTPLTIIRPGRPAQYLLTGYNVGTTMLTGTVGFKKDPNLTYTNFSVQPASQVGDNVSWNFYNLQPFDSVNFVITMLPATTFIGGEPMNYLLTITPVAGDAVPENNTIHFRHIIINSYDPNCKSNNMADSMHKNAVVNGEYIYYTIQFQNTGTASAIDISIKDTLSGKLIDSTLEIMRVSHSYTFGMKNKVATWNFLNINLPDSNANEKLSHGFIQYRIKAKPTLAVGDFIDNTAAIYFDFNPPVITENNRITIIAPIVTPPTPIITPSGKISFCAPVTLSTTQGQGYQWYKNGIAIPGAVNNTYIVQEAGAYTLTQTINNVSSNISSATTATVGTIPAANITKTNLLLQVQSPDATVTYTWQHLNGTVWEDVNPLVTGTIYTASVTGNYRVRIAKGVCTNTSNTLYWEEIPVVTPGVAVMLYPNPAGNFIKIENLQQAWATLEIINSIGEKIMKPVTINNLDEIEINIAGMPAGLYILMLRDGSGNVKREKFIKK